MGRRKDLGLLAVRLGTGGVLAVHGAQKLLGWFGGGGIAGTAKVMESLGFRPGTPSAIASGAAELGGGVLLALGLATPAAGAAVAGGMSGAVSVHRPAGFFATAGGYEYPAYLGFVSATIGVTGPGRYSLDRLLGYRLDRPRLVLLSFALSAAATSVVVARRETALAAQQQEHKEPHMPS
ncbi:MULTISPECIES: DoxX family protein [Streptomyces]|uniref:DoxX family protein n=1 Tax=Streptomyces TaxID=1883 RepID=UPI001C2EE381|nr:MULTISPECIES: DoxX family protein [Streptomyces]MBV1946766.1 DoxX family protein [Streptomyces sp. BV129]BDH06010.1 RpiR family transcriptional regulator [Streptomyces seoulensis]